MLKEYLHDIDQAVEEAISIVDKEVVLSGREEIIRYMEYKEPNKEITEETIAGLEGSIVGDILYKIDKAIQTGLKKINRYFIKTNIALDDLESYVTVTPNIKDLYKQKAQLVEIMANGTKFLKIANKKAPVLAGFNITLKQGVEIVKDNIDIVNKRDIYLNEFNNVLDIFMESKKDNVKLEIKNSEIKTIEEEVKKANNNLNMTTSKKLIVDRKPVKELVANFTELNKVVTELLQLGRFLNLEMLEDLNEKVSSSSTKLDIIQKGIEKDKIKISKKDFETFIRYIGAVAKYVTAVSFIMYFYLQLINMSVGIIKIATMFKDDGNVIDAISSFIKKNFNIVKNYMSK